MCEMSMKLPAMFDQKSPHTLKTFSPNGKVIAKIKRYLPREQKTCHPYL